MQNTKTIHCSNYECSLNIIVRIYTMEWRSTLNFHISILPISTFPSIPKYWKSRENFDVQKFHSLAILTPKYVQHGNKSIYKILHEFNCCVAGGRQRFHVSNNTGIFSTTSTLLPMPIVEWYFRGIQTFPECYSRFSQCYSTTIFALHALRVYFQVKFSHTRSNSFWKMPKLKRGLIYIANNKSLI